MLQKNPDALSDQEKIKLGLDTIKSFFDSLGTTDIYKQIVLEELMKFLIYGDTEIPEDDC